MVNALGLSVLVERPARFALFSSPASIHVVLTYLHRLYVKKGLHKSTSGATLNKLRIPSCTIELGPMRAVEPRCRYCTVL